jgi:hypothetical protein
VFSWGKPQDTFSHAPPRRHLMSPPAIKHPGDAATSGRALRREARPRGKIENHLYESMQGSGRRTKRGLAKGRTPDHPVSH